MTALLLSILAFQLGYPVIGTLALIWAVIKFIFNFANIIVKIMES